MKALSGIVGIWLLIGTVMAAINYPVVAMIVICAGITAVGAFFGVMWPGCWPRSKP